MRLNRRVLQHPTRLASEASAVGEMRGRGAKGSACELGCSSATSCPPVLLRSNSFLHISSSVSTISSSACCCCWLANACTFVVCQDERPPESAVQARAFPEDVPRRPKAKGPALSTISPAFFQLAAARAGSVGRAHQHACRECALSVGEIADARYVTPPSWLGGSALKLEEQAVLLPRAHQDGFVGEAADGHPARPSGSGTRAGPPPTTTPEGGRVVPRKQDRPRPACAKDQGAVASGRACSAYRRPAVAPGRP